MAKSLRSKTKRRFRTIRRNEIYAPIENKKLEEITKKIHEVSKQRLEEKEKELQKEKEIAQEKVEAVMQVDDGAGAETSETTEGGEGKTNNKYLFLSRRKARAARIKAKKKADKHKNLQKKRLRIKQAKMEQMQS